MTLVEHIQELRRRLIVSLIALGIGAIFGYIWYQNSAFGIPTLGEILRGPYCSLPPEKRASFSPDGQCRLLATAPFEMFMLRLKVGALAGTVISSPVWLGQIWGFITPGLLKHERRYSRIIISIAVLLFVAGATLAYAVVAYGLEFLLGVGQDVQVTALTGQLYYNFLLALLLIFGVSFEVPLFISVLNIFGVLTYDSIKDKRRIIIVVLFIFAAFMTPGQDPVSMAVLALALTGLVEMSMQFCRFNDKRRARKRPEWMDLDDDQASGPVSASGSIEDAAPLGAPAPINEAPGAVAASGPISAGPLEAPTPVRPSQRPTPGGVNRISGHPLPNNGNAEARGNLAERGGNDFDDVL